MIDLALKIISFFVIFYAGLIAISGVLALCDWLLDAITSPPKAKKPTELP